MKIFKFNLLILLFAFVGCNNEDANINQGDYLTLDEIETIGLNQLVLG